jgi:hypothetical protein
VDGEAVTDGMLVSGRARPDHPAWMREFLRILRANAPVGTESEAASPKVLEQGLRAIQRNGMAALVDLMRAQFVGERRQLPRRHANAGSKPSSSVRLTAPGLDTRPRAARALSGSTERKPSTSGVI